VETVPVSRFLNGTGVVLVEDEASAPLFETLAKSGIANARLEISWSKFDYHHEGELGRADGIRKTLALSREFGLRPLILINAHHGLPAPALTARTTVKENAPAGSRLIRIDRTDSVVPRRTGISNLSEFWAAEIIILDTHGDDVAELSKPLPRTYNAGEILELTTLKYEAFSVPGTARNEATLSGWLDYVDAVARVATEILGTADARDKGFDLEIWNELTFGSKFLSINNYYDPPLLSYRPESIYDEIVSRTAEHIAGRDAGFAGVHLVDGFASTMPWPAAADQHPRVRGLAKHPYVHYLRYPEDEQRNTVDIDRVHDAKRCAPRYAACFPEHAAMAIETESLTRDLAPMPNEIYGKRHGRLARLVNGKPAPVAVWLTEAGLMPKEIFGLAHTSCDPTWLKTRAAIRYFLFFLNKGAERVYLYQAAGAPDDYGLALKPDAAAQHDAYVSSTLRVLDRVCRMLRDEADGVDQASRAVSFEVGERQLIGLDDGCADLAGRIARDPASGLALLPFQINPSRFAIAYYAVSRNILVESPPFQVRTRISGVRGLRATLRSYDAVTDSWSPIETRDLEAAAASCMLVARDFPQFLVIDD
jgi:hypothetical protein